MRPTMNRPRPAFVRVGSRPCCRSLWMASWSTTPYGGRSGTWCGESWSAVRPRGSACGGFASPLSACPPAQGRQVTLARRCLGPGARSDRGSGARTADRLSVRRLSRSGEAHRRSPAVCPAPGQASGDRRPARAGPGQVGAIRTPLRPIAEQPPASAPAPVPEPGQPSAGAPAPDPEPGQPSATQAGA